MENKRGQWTNTATALTVIFAIMLGLTFFFNLFPSASDLSKFTNIGVSDAVQNSISYEQIIGPGFVFMDYVFGKVPSYLVELTSDVSSAIILIGLWLIVFLVLNDSVNLFGNFTKTTSFLIAFVIAVVMSNFKLLQLIAVYALFLTSGLGTLSVFASIIMVFVVFLGWTFGSNAIRTWVTQRATAEENLRAQKGMGRVRNGVRTAAEMGRAAAEEGE